MSLTAVRDSSTAPHNFLTNIAFAIAAFLTYEPKTAMRIIKKGKKARHTAA